ncbi:hypothetical protein OK074_0052 [Actinobacteria bacterium OK074]|nr:hypothetical protein OK074_0052 [Actinobacteria bacterium OK074]
MGHIHMILAIVLVIAGLTYGVVALLRRRRR